MTAASPQKWLREALSGECAMNKHSQEIPCSAARLGRLRFRFVCNDPQDDSVVRFGVFQPAGNTSTQKHTEPIEAQAGLDTLRYLRTKPLCVELAEQRPAFESNISYQCRSIFSSRASGRNFSVTSKDSNKIGNSAIIC